MKIYSWASLPLPLFVLTIGSCTSMQHAGIALKNVATTTNAKLSQVSSQAMAKIRPPRVNVVKVRENELKKLPSGREQALAFEKSQKRNFWVFNGPVDFKPPSLPEGSGDMDGGLLPPKKPIE